MAVRSQRLAWYSSAWSPAKDAAAARLHVGRAQVAQLAGQHRLDAAATGGEIGFHVHAVVAFHQPLTCRSASYNPIPTAVAKLRLRTLPAGIGIVTDRSA